MNRDAKRRKARRFGQLGEHLARLTLALRGYRTLARQFRTPVGEIDLVCRKGTSLVFVEVKSRRRRLASEPPVTPRQQRRISRAAAIYRQHNPHLEALDVRFDVLLIKPWKLPVVIRDAWRPGGEIG